MHSTKAMERKEARMQRRNGVHPGTWASSLVVPSKNDVVLFVGCTWLQEYLIASDLRKEPSEAAQHALWDGRALVCGLKLRALHGMETICSYAPRWPSIVVAQIVNCWQYSSRSQ